MLDAIRLTTAFIALHLENALSVIKDFTQVEVFASFVQSIA